MNTKSLFAAALLGTAVAIGTVGCANFTDKSAGETIDDTTIATKVKAKFVDDPTVKALNINVQRDEGRGPAFRLRQQRRRSRARPRASPATPSGVVSVKNDIRIATK